ncbi:hypothetical protein AXF42_Ash020730 [Apostasia shenzhenica]|uniref:Uncharacterized protein n=1 Tax=Apostasia shenzhenica TaxID=1088818 RepID=A0A2H9ZYA3_9ASPA|nr:hypothetical protein AXF42_Ash020730 [Apostasia shenzhenica]
MAGSAAAPGWFNWQGMWEASIPAFDGEIRRRPYHRNCGCALHRSRVVPADAPCPTSSTVSYPIRRRSSSWHCLTSSSSSSNLSGAASADASPRVSLDGNATAGDAAIVAFTIDSAYHA